MEANDTVVRKITNFNGMFDDTVDSPRKFLQEMQNNSKPTESNG
jgi:hypothetical protein